MEDTIRVNVDGVQKMDHQKTSGSFSAGKIGFYNDSQGAVQYGNVMLAPGSLDPVVPVLQDDVYGLDKNTTLAKDRFSGMLSNDYDANLDTFDLKVNG